MSDISDDAQHRKKQKTIKSQSRIQIGCAISLYALLFETNLFVLNKWFYYALWIQFYCCGACWSAHFHIWHFTVCFNGLHVLTGCIYKRPFYENLINPNISICRNEKYFILMLVLFFFRLIKLWPLLRYIIASSTVDSTWILEKVYVVIKYLCFHFGVLLFTQTDAYATKQNISKKQNKTTKIDLLSNVIIS